MFVYWFRPVGIISIIVYNLIFDPQKQKTTIYDLHGKIAYITYRNKNSSNNICIIF